MTALEIYKLLFTISGSLLGIMFVMVWFFFRGKFKEISDVSQAISSLKGIVDKLDSFYTNLLDWQQKIEKDIKDLREDESEKRKPIYGMIQDVQKDLNKVHEEMLEKINKVHKAQIKTEAKCEALHEIHHKDGSEKI